MQSRHQTPTDQLNASLGLALSNAGFTTLHEDFLVNGLARLRQRLHLAGRTQDESVPFDDGREFAPDDGLTLNRPHTNHSSELQHH